MYKKLRKYLFYKFFKKEVKELSKKRVQISSYTQIGRDKNYHEIIISDEYQTEHKNFDGSILKVSVKVI